MAQPMPPKTRQSGPEAKPADAADALHKLKPGGPIDQPAQGFINPGPTDNLRGVEPNTAMHRGEPNPDQHGSHGPIGNFVHDPGKGQTGNVHDRQSQGTPTPTGRTAEHSTKRPPPEPDPRGVRK